MSETTEHQGCVLRAYGRWQLGRLRRAYTDVSGWHSSLPGYDGFIEELQWGLEHLPPAVQAQGVEAILMTAFMGRFSVAALKGLAAVFPGGMARIVTWITPPAFGYLVGRMVRTGTDELDIPLCHFVQAGGSRICLEVCQAPTQTFFGRLHVPLVMDPNLETFECGWRYGREILRREDP